jgi:hypothetical protein
MSQNGPWSGPPPPPWSSGHDEPYTEPADPWGDQNTPAASAGWSGEPAPPSDPYAGATPSWNPPPMAALRPRRNGPILVLVIVLGLLVVTGLVTAAVLIGRNNATNAKGPVPPATHPTTAAHVADPQPSEDARFVKKGQCVRNEGSADTPAMTIVPCASGTYEVLKRVDGRTTGEADAEAKCSKVANYTKWYFYDSELDSLDFVLCLKER